MELGIIAYRTPIVRYNEKSSSGESSYFVGALDFLKNLIEKELGDLVLRKLLVGNSVSEKDNRSYSTRKVLSQHEVRRYLYDSSLSYIDTACLTSFSAIDLMQNIDKKSANVYIGFENLNHTDLIGVAMDTPEARFDSPQEISRPIANKWGISAQDINSYIDKSRSRANSLRSSEWYKKYLYIYSKRNISYDLHVENIPVVSDEGVPIHFGRLARGATVIITTGNLEIVRRLGGLIVKGIGVSSNIGSPDTLSPLVSSMKDALASSECGLTDLDIFEIFDSYLPVMIALTKELGLPLNRVNMCGNSIVHGDSISAAGGLLLGNVQSLFAKYSNLQLGLSVLYSMPAAISLVVQNTSK